MSQSAQGSLFSAHERGPLPRSGTSDIDDVIATLVEAYERGFLGGTSHELYPDVAPSTRERRLYFTLAPALNYQRKSELLWRSALRTYQDKRTRFVFDPRNVGRGESEYRAALTRYGLAVQAERQTQIWFRLSQTFTRDFEGDPIVLFQSCQFDVRKIVSLVTSRRPDFPYLSGPKLLNYWLYMISTFTDVPLVNRSAISIVPDVHVRRASCVLGLIDERAAESAESVARAWGDFLDGHHFSPVDLHAPLWRWSRAGFPPVEVLKKQLRGE
jgi:hypothetical protein